MCSRGQKKLLRIDLGQTDYKSCWDFQKQIVELRKDSKIADCLIFTDHKPVITMGRGTDKNNLLVSEEQLKKKKVDLYEIERGGDITFHGPGQAVIYPIIDLRSHGKDVHKYLRDLEQFVIRTLDDYGLKGSIKPGLTGIWVDDRKVGAIGVAVSRWVTYHGIALNVNTDMDYFKLINPCGITEYPVGSLSGLLGREIPLDEVYDKLAENFADHFYYEIENINDLEMFKSGAVE